MSKREGCFWCEYLGKEKCECSLDKEKDLNIFLIMDEIPDWCPKYKKGE